MSLSQKFEELEYRMTKAFLRALIHSLSRFENITSKGDKRCALYQINLQDDGYLTNEQVLEAIAKPQSRAVMVHAIGFRQISDFLWSFDPTEIAPSKQMELLRAKLLCCENRSNEIGRLVERLMHNSKTTIKLITFDIEIDLKEVVKREENKLNGEEPSIDRLAQLSEIQLLFGLRLIVNNSNEGLLWINKSIETARKINPLHPLVDICERGRSVANYQWFSTTSLIKAWIASHNNLTTLSDKAFELFG